VQSVFVITPCAPNGLPTQGEAIAKHLHQAGVRTSILSRAKSSWGRLLDIGVRGFFIMPFHDVALVNVYGSRAFVYEATAILYARVWKRRSVVFIRGGWMPTFVQKWPRWIRFVFSKANLILVPHEFLYAVLSASGLRVDGIIPNFIELEQYKFRERALLVPRFLYLRGMESTYNPAMALRAFAIIQQQYPEALLTMAGPESTDSALCRALVHELGLHNVHFIGQVPKGTIPALAEQHDIHLHTNRVENMPVSIIEMWACGVPIVGTNVGGMPYLVRHRVDGILVASEDYRAMAEACLELLAESELARMLSRNGRARAQVLTWESIAPAWARALALEVDVSG
jgi:glycosyltransferase involved in cell wall biosynthesis